MRPLARYWFLIPLFLVLAGLQVSRGPATAQNENGPAAGEMGQIRFYVSTSLPVPTATRRPALATSQMPAGPTPTSTLPPTDTPAVVIDGRSSPLATPGPLSTDTPAEVIDDRTLPEATPTRTPSPTSSPTPAPTPVEGGTSLRVPILMYHYTSDPPTGADAIRMDLSVTPSLFESHLAYLRYAGYETITLEQLGYALSRQGSLPEKPVVLTFDDGYRDNYENAFPLLRQYGYTGVFFLVTQPIDQNHESYLTWDMVIEMHRAGMEFGSHSYRHSDLTGRDADFLVYEILGSKEAIEARTGQPVRFFSYPAGRYDEATIKVVSSANFWGAVTTRWGVDQSFDKRFELVRLRVRGTDTVPVLAEKLNLDAY